MPLMLPRSVHSGWASLDDCDQVFPDELRVSSFPESFPHYAWTASGIVSPLRLRWVKGVCVFRCNLPPALLAEWSGYFTCNCRNTGVERTPNKSQHTKLTLEKKILPPLLSGFELATFRSRVRCSNNKLSRLTLLIGQDKNNVRSFGKIASLKAKKRTVILHEHNEKGKNELSACVVWILLSSRRPWLLTERPARCEGTSGQSKFSRLISTTSKKSESQVCHMTLDVWRELGRMKINT